MSGSTSAGRWRSMQAHAPVAPSAPRCARRAQSCRSPDGRRGLAEATRGLLMVGVGGQGVVMASNVVAGALMLAGHDVKKSEVHGMAQRGGVVYSHVRYGSRVASPLLERASAEVVVAFEWGEAIR